MAISCTVSSISGGLNLVALRCDVGGPALSSLFGGALFGFRPMRRRIRRNICDQRRKSSKIFASLRLNFSGNSDQTPLRTPPSRLPRPQISARKRNGTERRFPARNGPNLAKNRWIPIVRDRDRRGRPGFLSPLLWQRNQGFGRDHGGRDGEGGWPLPSLPRDAVFYFLFLVTMTRFWSTIPSREKRFF